MPAPEARSCLTPLPLLSSPPRRYVRLLHHPIAAVFSRCLSDFYSPAHGSIDHCPEVEGLTFGELHFRFPGGRTRHAWGTRLQPAPPDSLLQMLGRPLLAQDGSSVGEGAVLSRLPPGLPPADAVLVGLANRHTNKYLLNPAADTRVQHGDEIICMRPYLQKCAAGCGAVCAGPLGVLP
jgi:hypothetical protein